jgi:ABC-2 type transport system permease protein
MSGQVVERATAAGAAMSGSIYDLGYQHYDGARLGRRAVVRALFVESLRSCWGLGRTTRAKVVPLGLLALALLPAVFGVAVESMARGFVPDGIRYEDYFSTIVQILILFVAAQAPELVGRDQRSHVLPLYFSRPLSRLSYAFAKLAALVTSLLLITLLPQAVIFAGKVLMGTDVLGALETNLDKILPIVFTSVAAAVVMASIALAVGSYTPRRAYATAAIFAIFFVTLAGAAVVAQIDGSGPTRYALLVSPTLALEGLTAWSFDAASPNELLRDAKLPAELYLGAAAAMTVAAVALLALRYRRISA